MQGTAKLVAVAILHGDQHRLHWLLVTPVPHEGLCRFWVRSEKGSASYLVDIENDGGRCGCTNFSVERSKNPEHLCKHGLAARIYLGEDLVEKFLETKRHEQNMTRRLER